MRHARYSNNVSKLPYFRPKKTTGARRNKERLDEDIETYPEAVQFLFFTYASVQVIDEAYLEVRFLMQCPHTSKIEYCVQLWKKSLRCGNLFPDSTLGGMLVEGLHPSLKENIRTFLASHSNTNHDKIVRYAYSKGQFQRDQRSKNTAFANPADLPPYGRRTRGARLLMNLLSLGTSSSSAPYHSSETAEDDTGHVILGMPAPTRPRRYDLLRPHRLPQLQTQL